MIKVGHYSVSNAVKFKEGSESLEIQHTSNKTQTNLQRSSCSWLPSFNKMAYFIFLKQHQKRPL